MTEEFMPSPCKNCPFRTDVKPYLHPDRAFEIAASAENPYNDFPCHKTTTHDEDEFGEFLVDRETEKQCAGFLTLRARETSEGVPEGFKGAYDIVYEDADHMEAAYEEVWSR